MLAGTTGILNVCLPNVTAASHSERLFTIHLLGIIEYLRNQILSLHYPS